MPPTHPLRRYAKNPGLRSSFAERRSPRTPTKSTPDVPQDDTDEKLDLIADILWASFAPGAQEGQKFLGGYFTKSAPSIPAIGGAGGGKAGTAPTHKVGDFFWSASGKTCMTIKTEGGRPVRAPQAKCGAKEEEGLGDKTRKLAQAPSVEKAREEQPQKDKPQRAKRGDKNNTAELAQQEIQKVKDEGTTDEGVNKLTEYLFSMTVAELKRLKAQIGAKGAPRKADLIAKIKDVLGLGEAKPEQASEEQAPVEGTQPETQAEGGSRLPDPDKDLPGFSKRIQAIADSLPDGFGDNKVFISDVYAKAKESYPNLTMEQFKAALKKANKDGLLSLSRADMVQALDPRDVQDSEINLNPGEDAASHSSGLGGGATAHFILVASRDRKQKRPTGQVPQEEAPQDTPMEEVAPGAAGADAARNAESLHKIRQDQIAEREANEPKESELNPSEEAVPETPSEITPEAPNLDEVLQETPGQEVAEKLPDSATEQQPSGISPEATPEEIPQETASEEVPVDGPLDGPVEDAESPEQEPAQTPGQATTASPQNAASDQERKDAMLAALTEEMDPNDPEYAETRQEIDKFYQAIRGFDSAWINDLPIDEDISKYGHRLNGDKFPSVRRDVPARDRAAFAALRMASETDDPQYAGKPDLLYATHVSRIPYDVAVEIEEKFGLTPEQVKARKASERYRQNRTERLAHEAEDVGKTDEEKAAINKQRRQEAVERKRAQPPKINPFLVARRERDKKEMREFREQLKKDSSRELDTFDRGLLGTEGRATKQELDKIADTFNENQSNGLPPRIASALENTARSLARGRKPDADSLKTLQSVRDDSVGKQGYAAVQTVLKTAMSDLDAKGPDKQVDYDKPLGKNPNTMSDAEREDFRVLAHAAKTRGREAYPAYKKKQDAKRAKEDAKKAENEAKRAAQQPAQPTVDKSKVMGPRAILAAARAKKSEQQ